MRRIVLTASATVATLATVLATTGCGSSAGGAGAGGGTVTVGEATALSGSIAELGQSGLNGVELAAADINSSGGLLGKKIKVASADDGAQPATGTTNVRNMIVKDKAAAIFGPVSSAVAAAEQAVAAQYKVPIFFHTSNDAGLMTKTYTKYGFQDVPNTTMEPRAVADYLAKQANGQQITVATFAPDYSFGHDSVDGFLSALKSLNVNYKLVNQQFPALGETNIAPYLSKLVSASPDYVYNAQYGGDLVTFTKQAEGYGFFNKTKVIAMYDSAVLSALGNKAPAGAIGFDRAPFWMLGSDADAFIKAYKAKYGELPSEWAVLGYAAVQSWAYGVKKANSFDGDKVSDALSGATVPTIHGSLTYRACDHQADVPEYVGVVSSTPDSTYGIPLWDKDSQFTAPFDQIAGSC